MADAARVAMAASERGLRVDPDLPIAAAALTDSGLTVELVRWDDSNLGWDDYDLVVVRSCWDYAWRRAEFLAWAQSVPRLCNPAEVLGWNSDKVYLRDVGLGIPVVPTQWDPVAASTLLDASEWVVKPSISAGSRDTARWSDPEQALLHVGQLGQAGRTAMVQPYLPSVDIDGETALLFLGGRFSHAVRKGPLLGRGEGIRQDRDSRGDVREVRPTADQLEFGERVHATVRQHLPGARSLLYARIDVVAGTDGAPLLLELELTEPSLFLPQAPPGGRPFRRGS
jgi:glutathione synthase/RimK-type ligase-like ATP-grasp enzyme